MSDRPVRSVVFTDLDGTVLDTLTYDPTHARPALQALKTRAVPVVPVTSKTLSETRKWCERLGLVDAPMVAESGGVVRLPAGGGAEVIEVLGEPYAALRDALGVLRRELELPLIGFGDLSDEEVVQHTGLTPEEARDARTRLADEPFLSERPLSDDENDRLERAARARGLALDRGGRFFHLRGAIDKGRAVQRVLAWYEMRSGHRPFAVGVGNSPHDRPFLLVVDHPIAVPLEDGSVSPELLDLPGILITGRRGPEGFQEGILAWLAEKAEH